jgi:murein L,D-transpeptidase YcbB/YkuD
MLGIYKNDGQRTNKNIFKLCKFFLGTVVLGLVTLCVNKEIQERKIALEELAQLGQFLDYPLSQKAGVKRSFAQYFSYVASSDKLRPRWAEYYSIVDQEFQLKTKEKEGLEEKVETSVLSEQERENYKQQIVQLEEALSSIPSQRGETVRQAQIMLRDLGYDIRYIDGVAGPRTRYAIKKFQSEQGLIPDGILGRETFSEIEKQHKQIRVFNK